MIGGKLMSKKSLLKAKEKHEKYLKKLGISREQVKKKKKELGSPLQIPSYKTEQLYSLSNAIPANGTKSADTSKATFSTQNYAMVPSFNKGPIQPVSKTDLKNGAGRKL